jgi:hypothetical protein
MIRTPEGYLSLPIEDAVVSLTPLGTTPAAPPPSTVLMDQHDKEFVPYVLPVYGTPAAPVVFDKPGVVALGCNIYDWMLAYI